MLPRLIRFKNYMVFKEAEFDFSALGPVTLITGTTDKNTRKANGVGKSTLLSGIEYSVFEVTRAQGKKSVANGSVIRYGEKKCEVEYEFAIGSDVYKIVRTLAIIVPKGEDLEKIDRNSCKTKATVEFYVQATEQGKTFWKDISGSSKDETNAKILKEVGLDHELFINTCLFRQHEVSSFASKNGAERKEIVKRILQLDRYDQYTQIASSKLDELDKSVEAKDAILKQYANSEQIIVECKNKLDTLKTRVGLEETQIQLCTNKLAKLREEQAKYNSLHVQKESLGQQIQELVERMDEADDEIQAATQRITQYQAELDTNKAVFTKSKEEFLELKKDPSDLGILRAKATSVQEEGNKTQDKINQASVAIATLQEKCSFLQEQINQIEDLGVDECPTCFSQLTEVDKEEKIDKRIKELKELQQRIETLGSGLFDLEKTRDSYKSEYSSIIEKVEELRSRQSRMQQLESSLRSLHKESAQLTQILEDAQSIVDSFTKQKAELQIKLTLKEEEFAEVNELNPQRFEELSKQIESTNSDVSQHHLIVRDLEKRKGAVEMELSAAEANTKVVEQINSELSEVNRQRRIYRELVRGLGKQGVQAYILENSAAEIESIANEILDKVTDGETQIQIITTRETTMGTQQETFDIVIANKFHVNPIEMFSGGEKFRIAFAIRIALSILLARRAGVNISAIFYDEAFQDLDPDGIDKLVEMFTYLSELFPMQIVITHQPNLSVMFDNVVVIEKDKDGAHIKA